MRRRDFLASLILLFGSKQTNAQPPARPWRIGFLDTAPRNLNSENIAAFLDGLRSIGLQEGRDFAIDYRSAANADELDALVSGLVAPPADLIVVRGTPEVLAVKRATTTIPVVMLAVVDPVHAGIVSSLQQPGGNITGMASAVTALEQKRVQLLKDLLPALTSLAVIGDFRNPAVQEQWDQVRSAAAPLGIQKVIKFAVQDRADFEWVFRTIKQEELEAARVGVDGVTRPNRKLIIELCDGYKVPAVFAAREFAAEGGLLALGADYQFLYRHAAAFIAKIHNGESPATIPVKNQLPLNSRST